MSGFKRNPEVAGPLSGYRVIEFAANMTVPVAGMYLGDQGADVIKVESFTGDQQRYSTATRLGVPSMAAAFATCNRNKRSIHFDMKKKSSVEAFLKLVKSADVVVQNFRPGVMERFGLGYEELKKANDKIIMVSVSGFGPTGPYSAQRTYDTVVQGVSGITFSQKDYATGEPTLVKTSMIDKVTALFVFQAVTAALLAREHTGKGQHVQINMLDCALSFLWPDNFANETWQGEDVKLGGDMSEVRYIFKTKDSYLIVMSLADAEWAGICNAVGRPHLITDPRFVDIALRIKNFKGQYEVLKDAFEGKTTEEWLDILRAHDTVCGPVNSPDNVHLDPQVVHSQLVVESNHPHAGPYRQARHAAQFADTPAAIRLHAPMLGEQTDDILREIGYSDAELDALKREGATK